MTLPEKTTSVASSAQTHSNYTAASNSSSLRQNNTTRAASLDERLALYDEAVNQNNSTETVVEIGKKLQEEFYNLTTSQPTRTTASPSNHTGNWKTSFLYNLAQLIAHIVPPQILPAKIAKPTIIPPAANATGNSTTEISQRASNASISQNTTSLSQPVIGGGGRPTAKKKVLGTLVKKSASYRYKKTLKTTAKRAPRHISKSSSVIASSAALEPSFIEKTENQLIEKTVSADSVQNVEDSPSFSRRKRALEEEAQEAGAEKYDLTPENIVDKLGLTEAQKKTCRASINNIKKAIGYYNNLAEKNSRKGQDLLVKQSVFLETIQKKAGLPETHASAKVMTTIKTEFLSHRVAVNKHLHGIWIAGSPPDDVSPYIKVFLQTYEDFDFFFWVDESAYGAAKFSSTLKRIAFDASITEIKEKTPEAAKDFIQNYEELKKKYDSAEDAEQKEQYQKDLHDFSEKYDKLNKEVKENFNALFLKNMITSQDGFFNFCMLKGTSTVTDALRIEYLEQNLKLPQEEIEQYKKTIEDNKKKIQDIVAKANKGLGSERVKIKDIKELTSMKDKTNLYNYEMEMFLRWNYAAASDQIRMYMLKEYGGIYTDLDIMPSYSQEATDAIFSKGGNRFFENLQIRRVISTAALKIATEETPVTLEEISKEIKTSQLTREDKKKLKELIPELEKLHKDEGGGGKGKSKKGLFQTMAPDTVRDTMPVLRRYHKWSTGWNVRILNGLMMAHKDSAAVDAVIKGQQRAYAELKDLRENVLSGTFFNTLDDLTHLDQKDRVGHYLVKDYLGKSLFYNFRQDSIIPGAVSTLGITGPDLIKKELVKYFKDFGPMGKEFLNENGRNLGDSAYLGSYKQIKDEHGETTYDWKNPLSVGANDVTPGDESSWCNVRQKCAGELLFSDSSKLRVETPKGIERTKVNEADFTKLWKEESRKKLPNRLLARFNELIDNPNIDVAKLSDLDYDILKAKLAITNDPAATTSLFSLQLQLANLIRGVQLPVGNQMNFFPDLYKNVEDDLEKAIKLYLKSHSQTTITLWYSSSGNLSLFLRDMLSVAERQLAVGNLIDSVGQAPLSEKQINLLTTYVELKSKEILSSFSSDEDLTNFLETLNSITEDAQLRPQIEKIEEKISSGHFYQDLEELINKCLGLPEHKRRKLILDTMKDITRFSGLDKQEQQSAQKWYEKIYDTTLEKRVLNPQKKLEALLKKFESSERVRLENLDLFLRDRSLFSRMHRDGYAFADSNDLYRFMVAEAGISGIFSVDSVLPPPSKHLVNMMKTTLNADYEDMHDTLGAVYNYLALDPETEEAKAALDKIPEGLREKLQNSHIPDLLIPPIDSHVSALGMQYGVEEGGESERIMASIMPGEFNPTSYIMSSYLDTLYQLHQRIHDGSLTLESAKKLLNENHIYCFVEDTRLQELVNLAQEKKYLSLTEINKLLSKKKNFAQAASALLDGVLPGANQILQRDADFGRPLATTMLEPTAMNPYDYRGAGLSKDLFSTPPDVPTLPNVVERAKYSLMAWPDFSREHIHPWSVLARTFGSNIVHVHPQTFLYDLEGRCMGLAMLYMSAKTPVEYAFLTQNLMTVSSLFQTKERDHLPLSEADNKFLLKSQSYIDWLQYRGNKEIKTQGILTPHTWDIAALSEKFSKSTGSKSLLVTTPTHSLVVQHLDWGYRFTDPNFGHCDFATLQQALSFLESSVQLSEEVKLRYGISEHKDIKEQLKVYTLDSQKAENSWFPSTNLKFLSYDQHMITLDKMILRGDVYVGRKKISWRHLYAAGATIDHKRIDEKTRETDLDKLQINGEILSDFLSRNTLDAPLASTIQYLLDTYGTEPGTKEVSRSLIVETPRDFASIIGGFKTKAHQMSAMLRNVMDSIRSSIKDIPPGNQDRVSVTDIEVDGEDRISFKFKCGSSPEKKIQIPSHGLVKVFRQLGGMLNDLAGTGVMDMELGMSAVSIIQYARLVEAGKGGSALAIFNLSLDVKEMAEMTLGAIVQGVGKKFITEKGIDGLRLESVLSKQLIKVSNKVGGTVGKALFRVGQMLELPILETVAGVWGLYNSVEELMQASSHSDMMGARVQVAFDVISLALTLSAVVAPAAMLAAGPIAAIGMGASSIARNVAKTEGRHKEWGKYKKFLEDGSEHVVTAFPERGLIDLSGNQILGNIYLDLTHNPPIFKGERSYNANRWIGHKPHLSDHQIREKLGYAFRITPTYALALGHANSYWPPEVPHIPAGTYNTVILGYGITYKGTTEVVYLSNKIVWREAIMDPESRYFVSPLTAQNHRSTVITGKTHTTIVPVRLLDDDSKERLDQALEYKNYEIRIQGGSGGVSVQIGGAGYYNLTGAPGAENVISFRAIPPPLAVQFNLSQGLQDVPLIRPNGTKINMLKIKQKGFSTIIGSSGGQDTLTGHRDTKFYVSPGGGKVYSGAGTNWYYIPKLNENLTIVLATNSTDHSLHLNMHSYELHSVENNLNLLGLNGDKHKGIYIENADKSSLFDRWIGHFIVKFSDGITVEAVERPIPGNHTNATTLGFTKCDQSTWALKHPEEPGFVDNIVKWMKKYLWWFAPEVSITQQHGHVSYFDQEKLFVYKPDKHSELEIRAQEEFLTTVQGSVGSSYILSSAPNKQAKRIDIVLAKDEDAPQYLDLSSLIPSLVKGRITNGSNSSIDLEISSPRYTIPLSLQWDPEALPEKTVIEVHPQNRPTLGEWYKILKKDPTQWHTLYRYSVLIPERLEGILSMNNTATLMLSESRKNEEHILGVENKGDVNLKIWGTLWAGHIKGAMRHLHWKTFNNYRALEKFGITIDAHGFQYLAFEGTEKSGDNILFHSVLESYPFKAKQTPQTELSHHKWKFYDEIQVFATTLHLQDFNRYHIASENKALSRQLLYAKNLVSISNRDFIVKLFYVREGFGIGAMRLVFKNFFNEHMEDITEKTLEREAKPWMASNPHAFIDPSYQNHLELILGKERLNLATLVREFCASSHILPLSEDEDHRLILPERYQPANLAVLTYTIDSNKIHNGPANTLRFFDNTMKEYRLPLTTILKSSYYLDPVTGDLYITRLVAEQTDIQHQAFVIKLKGFKRHWESYKHIFISGAHVGLTRSKGTALTFIGPELRHLEIDFPRNTTHHVFPERLVSRSGLVFPTNDQVVNYDPRIDKQFHTILDYMLWNLRDRAWGSKRAKAYDSYLLESAMHIYDKNPQWKIPESMLHYAIGYYKVQVPRWVRSHMRPYTLVKMLKGSITLSLITTQNEIFAHKRGSGFNIYFALLGLNKHVEPHSNKPGDMTLRLKQDVILKVRKVDESEYQKKRVYVVAEIATEEDRSLRPNSQVLIFPGGEKIRYRRSLKNPKESNSTITD
ncbi:LifA/Efa1-related large cytotoxin [Chlamydia caviae]|uniref:Cytotoxin n=1 Tax=Chlamydia caviae (strain ATCC VR-813 / DSM 19441 / 03DC25 / GPIC) TaxID=227941 RepID=Q822X0_CHLCV|nr:LifA/Efa1-related large cytotoxin [Chlamydia caviae]AAP05301.1 putative cytotoxin [Chlamydia caviae GPIC]